ncbi:glutamine synthetase/guanido kinase [Fomitiporia mediterranea MF3/22]|uniref:glutamine synthetase/guanido kinase n=1 Tax=Fomitiporia mediterranea (strain MF3/22) TaxID=694068 RepID=UPI000440836E|nr:glutamine synthetase/guanido kinase [Fomitiporia mediterranea MF3/22]EJD07922.1 glutamine synthetase/guanido kinase [Fomitiporia mediterranea MF3/22]
MSKLGGQAVSIPPDCLDILNDEQVQFVRIVWVDFVNFVRYRVVPIRHFRKLVSETSSPATTNGHSTPRQVNSNKEHGHLVEYNPHGGIQLTKASFGLAFLSLAEGFGAIGEYVYVPDLASARLLQYAPGHVSVMGWLEEKEVFEKKASFEATFCPRALLRRIVEHVRKTEGVEFLIGFETEVIFLSSVNPIQAVNDYGWSETSAILAGTPEAKALEEIADAFEYAGIELQMYHAEAAPGQYEFVTGPLPPLEACDALATTREIILNIAAKHGMRATLAPRVYSNSCGSAAHAHISLTSTSPSWSSLTIPVPTTSLPNVSLTPLQSSFLAGLMAHLPAATALTLPTRASYDRMVDGAWSGGTWVCWGRDNREAPVRLAGRGPRPPLGNANQNVETDYHFEIKSVDGTASPYLAIAALLSAGLSGVYNRSKLTSVGLSSIVASDLSEAERKKCGVVNRMPLSIDEARKALQENKVLRDDFGEEFIEAYLSVNKAMDEQLKAPTAEEARVKLVKTY